MDWIGLDWVTSRSRYFNVIPIVIALDHTVSVSRFSDFHSTTLHSLTNWLLLLLYLVVIHVNDCMHQFKMLNRFL